MINNLEYQIRRRISHLQEGSEPIRIKAICDFSREELLQIFKKFTLRLSPIYWPQKVPFKKLLDSTSRTAKILEINGVPIGILAFKNELIKEEECLPLQNWYLEIKSLFLRSNFWNWYIRFLWEELVNILREQYKNADWIYLTVSTTKAPESYQMFRKLGFRELYRVHNEYSLWNEESHMFLPLNIELPPKRREFTIRKRYLEAIKKGFKTVEWRSGKIFLKIKKWDIITFRSWRETKEVTVKDVIRYTSIEDFLNNEGIQNCLPDVSSIEEWKSIYMNLPWYAKKVSKYGIVAFKI